MGLSPQQQQQQAAAAQSNAGPAVPSTALSGLPPPLWNRGPPPDLSDISAGFIERKQAAAAAASSRSRSTYNPVLERRQACLMVQMGARKKAGGH